MNEIHRKAYIRSLVLSIFQMLCCNLITGLLSLIYVIVANSQYNIGDKLGYTKYMTYSRYARTVGWVLWILLTVISIITVVLIYVIGASTY